MIVRCMRTSVKFLVGQEHASLGDHEQLINTR